MTIAVIERRTGAAAATEARLPKHLRRLESESIEIMREVVADFRKPAMLYSIGKDLSVMLHLAVKAFYPAPLPFPLLHVDTTWKFREMIRFRDETARRLKLDLLVHVNADGLRQGVDPFTSGPAIHTQVMKTEALKQALENMALMQRSAAPGATRRRAGPKNEFFRFGTRIKLWDPRDQRPELWNIFNTRIAPGKSMRVFPLSNWTELDVWHYIAAENIPIVPLYLADERPVVERSGTWIMVDDDRLPLKPGERPQMRRVRFRTLGCYPLTGAIESEAATIVGCHTRNGNRACLGTTGAID